MGFASTRRARSMMPILTGIVALAVLMTTTIAAAAPHPPGGPPVPVLRWNQPCPGEPSGFTCATARVPLDYDDPRGPTIELALIKRPTTDRQHRIGTLFFNSGGPGNALTGFLPALYDRFPPAVRERFDIVGFDPRGIGESTSVQCFATPEDEGRLLAQLPPGFPITPAEEERTNDVFAAFSAACAAGHPRLLSHLSTANTARDMDLLRRAVGDPKLSYYGLSYGTLIGATYANLFPGQIRAMVLDSVLDPVGYTTGRHGEAGRLGTALRLGEDLDRLHTLDAFLDLCGRAGPERCAFSTGTAAGTRAKYATLLSELRRRPIQLGDTTFTYASAITALVGTLEATTAIPGAVDAGWPEGAELLQALWTAGSSPAGSSPAGARTKSAVKYAGPEQFFAVACSESPNPRDPAAYPVQADWAHGRSGDLGRLSAWRIGICATWKFTDEDRYAGPWDRRTSVPILVIGVTTDPQTGYRHSVALSEELSRARLLTIDGYGHGALQNKSSCADDHQASYLIAGRLPAPDTTCRQDQAPFAGNDGGAGPR